MRIALAVVVGIAVFFVVVPTSGVESHCYSVLAFEVPCEGGAAAAIGATTTVVVGLVLWLVRRRSAS